MSPPMFHAVGMEMSPVMGMVIWHCPALLMFSLSPITLDKIEIFQQGLFHLILHNIQAVCTADCLAGSACLCNNGTRWDCIFI